ncbi:MAG: hypothetical protein IJV30_06960 [Oscillospiraceae bacterium]|nr:hypothetical protein [Oscillospiraceae bacterium]
MSSVITGRSEASVKKAKLPYRLFSDWISIFQASSVCPHFLKRQGRNQHYYYIDEYLNRQEGTAKKIPIFLLSKTFFAFYRKKESNVTQKGNKNTVAGQNRK